MGRCRCREGVLGLSGLQGCGEEEPGVFARTRCGGALRRQHRRGSQEALGCVGGTVPNKLFSTVDPLAANAAAKAFYEFKDVVKAARGAEPPRRKPRSFKVSAHVEV